MDNCLYPAYGYTTNIRLYRMGRYIDFFIEYYQNLK